MSSAYAALPPMADRCDNSSSRSDIPAHSATSADVARCNNQALANETPAHRERNNVYDTATVLVAQIRLAGIDKWEAGQIAQVRAEGERRRQQHRSHAGAAITRLQARGKSLDTIATVSGMSVAAVRALLKYAPGKRANGHDVVTAELDTFGGGAGGGGIA